MTDSTLELPHKQPALRVVPQPHDANVHGDVFGGWIMSQVDIAGSIPASQRANGRVATVAVNSFVFKQPVFVGDLLSFYATITRTGNTSVTVDVEVYAQRMRLMGEIVKVKDGFARNFLLKRGKALRATAENRTKYDGMKAELEANNIKAKGEAAKVAEKIDGRDVVIIRQASESGQLFGSVSVRDIVASLAADGITVSRPQVWLDAPIKTIGQKTITVAVHPEVEATISVTVARSDDEAERIKRGEDISTRQEDRDAAAEAIAAAGEFFDPEAQHDDLTPPKAEEATEEK